jgi:hypothetical protein
LKKSNSSIYSLSSESKKKTKGEVEQAFTDSIDKSKAKTPPLEEGEFISDIHIPETQFDVSIQKRRKESIQQL